MSWALSSLDRRRQSRERFGKDRAMLAARSDTAGYRTQADR